MDGRILRAVTDEAAARALREALELDVVRRAVTEGRLIRSRELARSEWPEALTRGALPTPGMVLEHERVPFRSYPYEWPPEMLAAAGRLTLDLARGLLDPSHGLKDATPYNVLFRGPRPVFVDVLSIERRDPREPTWRAYAQFTRTFLAPLAASGAFSLRPDALLLTRRDGLEPEDLYALAGPLRRLSPAFLTLATLPVWLAGLKRGSQESLYAPRLLDDPEQARYVLGSILAGLGRRLARLEPRRGASSRWSAYEQESLYTARDHEARNAFVAAALALRPSQSVLDLGCNTGRFSLLAARSGARVVAVDSDPVVVGELFRRSQEEERDILPLVVDVARPTPAMGWRNGEQVSFLDRARGAFDLVLMLALVHHLSVGEGVPLPEVAGLAAELTRDLALVEHVEPSDPQFHRLARGRDALFAGQGRAAFEAAFEAHFETVRVQALPDAPRSLHLLRLRRSARG